MRRRLTKKISKIFLFELPNSALLITILSTRPVRNVLPAVPSLLNRAQEVHNTQREIASINREIAARERYVESNNEVIALYRESFKQGEELLKLHKEQRQALVEHRQLLIESRDLDRKQIALLKESKELDREKINILENTNTVLRSTLKQIRSKSVEPIQTSKLPDIDEKTHKVSPLNTAFIADSKEAKEIKNLLPQEDTIKKQSVSVQTEESLTAKEQRMATRREIAEAKANVPTEQQVQPRKESSTSSNTASTSIFNQEAKELTQLVKEIAHVESQKAVLDAKLKNMVYNPINYTPNTPVMVQVKDNDIFTREMQERALQSQQNWHESIVARKVHKLL